jgi:putative DNA primase/helicase
VARIPQATDGSRRGADDLLVQAGDAAFAEIIDGAIPAHATTAQVLRATGLDALGKKPNIDLVEDALRNLRHNLNGSDPLRRAAIREAAIKKLDAAGISASARMVDAALGAGPEKTDDRGQGRAIALADPEPWPEPVDGAILMNDLLDLFRRYLILPKGGHVAFALWLLHAHTFDLFSVSPFLIFESPTKRAGKTRALTIASTIAPRPLMASSVTAAVLFRAIEHFRPTLLIDEFDAGDRNDEALRGILNSGHTRAGAFALRAVGDDFEPRLFSTWAPKVIAAIGDLPETIADRGITINMRRRAPGEKIDRLRLDRLAELEPLRQKAARWALDNADALRTSDPTIPAGLGDRAADNWLPLFAIADLCGLYGEDARHAALILSGSEEETGNNAGVRLLADIKVIFEEQNTDRLASEILVTILGRMEDRPWPEWRRGKPITAVQLGRLLKPFGISSTQLWGDGGNRRGYEKTAFADAWARYQPGPSTSSGDGLAAGNSASASPNPAPEAASSTLALQVGGAPDDRG